MNTNELLANIRVASPCPARWDEMSGDHQARFCAQCRKHVYNLSNLTAEEAAALVRSKDGKLCARFYQRADGTVLTADCPIGAGHVWSRFKLLGGAAAALLMVGLAVPLFANGNRTTELPRARNKVHRAWDDAVGTVKQWLGVRQPAPRMIMGDICIATPQPKTSSPQVPPQATPK